MTKTTPRASAPSEPRALTRRTPGTRSSASSKPATATRPDIRIRRFDADRKDTILTLEEALEEAPDKRQLLWIDITGSLAHDASARLAERFDLDDKTREALAEPGDRPSLTIHGTYFHVRVATEPTGKPRDEPTWLDVVAGTDNVVISRHTAAAGLLEDVDERMDADSSVGVLESATFVALLLDAAVTSYFEAVDAVEDELDDLDAQALDGREHREMLEELVTLRRRVARLRRVLTDHRSVFAALGQTSMAQLFDDETGAAALVAVGKRFGEAVAAVEDSRAALVGSFDVLMTRTAQRTNDVMKILAITTVLLLPGSLIAGLLGMNVSIPLDKESPVSFWLVIGGVVALAAVVIAVARLRRWL